MNTLLGFPEGNVGTSFGKLLRRWRDARGMSQLTLACEAGISTRHLSFLETGRAPDLDLFTDQERDDVNCNVMRTVFHPQGLRRYIVNWEELAECLVNSLHRQVAATGSDAMARLRDELLDYPGVPTRWSVPDPTIAMPPLVSMQLRKDDLSLTFFSMITTLGTPRDVTLQQLKIECFFPADVATEQLARSLASAAPRPIAV